MKALNFLKEIDYLPLRYEREFSPENLTKEKYIEFKKKWKSVYNELSSDIKTGKKKRKLSKSGYVFDLDFNQWLAKHMMNALMVIKSLKNNILQSHHF